MIKFVRGVRTTCVRIWIRKCDNYNYADVEIRLCRPGAADGEAAGRWGIGRLRILGGRGREDGFPPAI